MIKSNIKFLLLKNNMKLKQLAEITNINYFYLSNLQNNKVKELKLTDINKLKKALNCKFKDLFIDEDDEDNSKSNIEKKIKNIA